MIRKRDITAVLLLLSWREEALAAAYNLPDLPGAIVFESVPLKSVRAPNALVPADCDPAFRAQMEGAFRQVWRRCQAAGKMEPSDCQRGLFGRCTELAASLQGIESRACAHMQGESEALEGFKAVSTQKNAEDSSADLNRRAYIATTRVIQGLEQSLKELEGQAGKAKALLAADTCRQSSSRAQYRALGKAVASETDQAQGRLRALLQGKKSSAEQFARDSGLSQQRLAELVSLAPAQALSLTAVSQEPGAGASTITSAPGSAMAPAPGPVVAPGGPAIPYFPPSSASGSRRKIPWVPILAAGVPAAVLAGILIAKSSPNRPEGGGDYGPTVTPSGREGDPVPGGGELSRWNMTVDSSFTDKERAIIATGAGKIPDCYRYKLRGIHVRKASLGRASSDKCVAGQYDRRSTVSLSPSCAVGIGICVHEFAHVVGIRDGEAMHQQFMPLTRQYPNCPVTEYGGTNFVEDFAETSRLALYPESGRHQQTGLRYSAACVDRKIEGLQRILNRCPGGR